MKLVVRREYGHLALVDLDGKNKSGRRTVWRRVEGSVQLYEVVCLDALGREAKRQELRCRNDEEAVDRAAALRSRHGVEVWFDGALIWHWEPSSL